MSAEVVELGAVSSDRKRNAGAMLRDLARQAEEGKLAGLAVAIVVVGEDGGLDIGHGVAPCCDKPNLAMLLAAVTMVQADVIKRFE